jgi:hypothetical protein
VIFGGGKRYYALYAQEIPENKQKQALERRTRKERIEYEESYQRIIVRKKTR